MLINIFILLIYFLNKFYLIIGTKEIIEIENINNNKINKEPIQINSESIINEQRKFASEMKFKEDYKSWEIAMKRWMDGISTYGNFGLQLIELSEYSLLNLAKKDEKKKLKEKESIQRLMKTKLNILKEQFSSNNKMRINLYNQTREEIVKSAEQKIQILNKKYKEFNKNLFLNEKMFLNFLEEKEKIKFKKIMKLKKELSKERERILLENNENINNGSNLSFDTTSSTSSFFTSSSSSNLTSSSSSAFSPSFFI
uniref:Uncharacterized protein n=1 Tax=Meloidogyne enterolobii TaxID=390850 RepID=A0A6V7UM09_MELEN|nr:unnamed protein product [Meloidogyne enterolobii]